jgi:hypothetical protein
MSGALAILFSFLLVVIVVNTAVAILDWRAGAHRQEPVRRRARSRAERGTGIWAAGGFHGGGYGGGSCGGGGGDCGDGGGAGGCGGCGGGS